MKSDDEDMASVIVNIRDEAMGLEDSSPERKSSSG